jgi:hypothetical protein
MEVSITGLGTLTNKVASAEEAPPACESVRLAGGVFGAE